MSALSGRRAPLFLLIVGALLTGCDPSAESALSTTVRDSAGIRIVENAIPIWAEGEAWTISAEPVQTFGNRQGEPPLSNILAVIRLSDGRVVAADNLEQFVHYFSPDGTLEISTGGPGGGPGEFNQITATLRYRGDSILVHDGRNARMSILSPEGTLGRSIMIDGGYRIRPSAAQSTGAVLWTPSVYSPEGDGVNGWMDLPVQVTEGDSGRPDTLLALPMVYREFSGGEFVRLGFPPSGRRGFSAREILWGRTDTPAIHFFDSTGSLVNVIRWSPERAEVDDTIRNILLERALESNRSLPAGFAESEEEVRRRHGADYFPNVVPAFSDIVVDRTEDMWLRGPTVPTLDTDRTWQVFDPDGVWLGEVVAPEGLTVHEIGEDYVLGVTLDDFDVPTVVLHELIKP